MRALTTTALIAALSACAGSSKPDSSGPASATPVTPEAPATAEPDKPEMLRLVFDAAAEAELEAAADIARARLAAQGLSGAEVSVDGAALVVEIAADDRGRAPEVVRALTSPGVLSMHVVDSGSKAMKQLYAEISRRGSGPLTGGVDEWVDHDNNKVTDHYIRGPTRESVAQVFADVSATGRVAGFERVAAGGDERWRSYWLVTPPILNNDAIASVRAVTPAGKPSGVLIELEPAAATRFSEATEKHIGKKIAIVLDGQVRIAPVVAQKITGGEISLTTGAADPESSAAEARLLAAMLESGVLPELELRRESKR